MVLAAAVMFFVGMDMGGFQLGLSDVSAEFHTVKTGMGLLVAAQLEQMLKETIRQAIGKGLIKTTTIMVDATHVSQKSCLAICFFDDLHILTQLTSALLTLNQIDSVVTEMMAANADCLQNYR